MLSTAALPVAADDTTAALTPRLAALGAALLVETLPAHLRGDIRPQPQTEAGATYAPRIDKKDGQIDWREPADLIARRVRAYQPWPSAYTTWNGQLLKVLRSRAGDEAVADIAAGAVIAGPHGSAGVVTGRGVLWLEEVQLAGKRALPIEAFVAGARGFVGSRL
ncbi:MAG: Methionyl-tRNA formyltransferase [Chloroflexi bacterium ADurb.Bin325]|nr:MAG: Methionyl-tRNA formyltransferase [Chloroflexi bacterium ADurb.Bin325]